MSFSSSDFVPYVIGTVITFVIARWLFSRVDNRPPNSPSLYFSYSPDPDSVAELQRMFPNIPQMYIVRELDRANGVASVAVDALVLMNPDFSGGETPQVPTRESLPAGYGVTHGAILEEINSSAAQEMDAPLEEPVISRKDWDSTNAKTRQRVLAERKKLMLLRAREAFRKSSEAN